MTTRVKTQSIVKVYEFLGKEIKPGGEVRPVKIRTHWTRDDMVVLCVGNDHYTILASDLVLAIKRCSR